MNVDSYRRQHAEAADVLGRLETELDERALSADASTACSLVARLSGKLRVHLSAEDGSLYPALLASGDAGVAQMARRFQDDMGRLATAFGDYAKSWTTPHKIQDDAGEFTVRTREVVKALRERIAREENDLYPLAETV